MAPSAYRLVAQYRRLPALTSENCANDLCIPKNLSSVRSVLGVTIGDDAPWVIALDLDGTVIHQDGSISEAVASQVRRVAEAGHHVVFATGRSFVTTAPVLAQLVIAPRFVVCCNGAVVLQYAAGGAGTYHRRWVDTFDPTDTLRLIHDRLGDAVYAVEDEVGHHRYAGPLPDDRNNFDGERVEFDDLLHRLATRVVVVAPDCDRDEFLTLVDQMGLHHVSYTVGWTAWLDIAGAGVNKATALERVRTELGIPSERVIAVGDGLNDIEMLSWASQRGRGVAMGQSPAAVLDIATESTGSIQEDGLAQVLAEL